MSKIPVNFEDGKMVFGLDLNEDGEKSVEGVLHLSEALQEAISRGEAVEGAKLVDFRFELTKMVLVIDTDKDGESLLELKIDLPEAFDEGQSLLLKKDEE
jgi:hypothetical protein